eukprot:403371711
MLQIVTDNGYFQTVANTLLSMFVIMYLMHTRPYKLQFTNKLEIFNEICIMLVNYHMIYFLEPNGYSDADMLYSFGYIAIGITAFSLIANTSITFAISLKLMKNNLIQMYRNKCKKKYKINQKDQIFNKRQGRLRSQRHSSKYDTTMTSQADFLDSFNQTMNTPSKLKLSIQDRQIQKQFQKSQSNKSKNKVPKNKNKKSQNTKSLNKKLQETKKIKNKKNRQQTEVRDDQTQKQDLFLEDYLTSSNMNGLKQQNKASDNDLVFVQIFPSQNMQTNPFKSNLLTINQNMSLKTKSMLKIQRQQAQPNNEQLQIKRLKQDPQNIQEDRCAKQANVSDQRFYNRAFEDLDQYLQRAQNQSSLDLKFQNQMIKDFDQVIQEHKKYNYFKQ